MSQSNGTDSMNVGMETWWRWLIEGRNKHQNEQQREMGTFEWLLVSQTAADLLGFNKTGTQLTNRSAEFPDFFFPVNKVFPLPW